MEDKQKLIFGNQISPKTNRKAQHSKASYEKKYGNDSGRSYYLKDSSNPVIGDSLGVVNLNLSQTPHGDFGEKPLIVGNIRMGFGHYRISMAIASAAHALGYTPYWFDLNSYTDTTCGKIISHQNDLYSMGSRLSQRFSLFNKLIWEPLNSQGFRKLSYHAVDLENAKLMAPVYQDLPKDIPFVATHAWPAQAAVCAGLTHVVNAIPDNWPMALHLSEGAIHTVQTPSSYLGYRTLRGMCPGKIPSPMPKDAVVYTGHYIDHELVSHIEEDCSKRIHRLKTGEPTRYLLTIGGAGAQAALMEQIIKKLLPQVSSGKAAICINVGDHLSVWESLLETIPDLKSLATCHFNDFHQTDSFAASMAHTKLTGIHVFYHQDIFAAVYSTNLLMRHCDVLVTKPSELAFYPIPKLLIHRIGGHEAWGAIRSAEIGDGTFECDTHEELVSILNLLEADPSVLIEMCHHILTANQAGIYNGAYRVVELATGNLTVDKLRQYPQ